MTSLTLGEFREWSRRLPEDTLLLFAVAGDQLLARDVVPLAVGATAAGAYLVAYEELVSGDGWLPWLRSMLDRSPAPATGEWVPRCQLFPSKPMRDAFDFVVARSPEKYRNVRASLTSVCTIRQQAGAGG